MIIVVITGSSSSKHCTTIKVGMGSKQEDFLAERDILIYIFNIDILKRGHFADKWKKAIVTPLLKKPGTEMLFKNLRPVSNLAFISKLTETAVADQLQSHISRHGLYPVLQSAYRCHHSCETALLKVRNDILLNMNKQHVTLLVLLDLSAAFDTVNHEILLESMTSKLGTLWLLIICTSGLLSMWMTIQWKVTDEEALTNYS